MKKYAAHLWRKWFRGAETERVQTEFNGMLVLYKSGYVELLLDSGERYDCWLEEQRGRIPWKCVGTQGSGRFVTPPMTLTEAKRHVSDIAGVIVHTDVKTGHIFYKQSLDQRSSLTG